MFDRVLTSCIVVPYLCIIKQQPTHMKKIAMLICFLGLSAIVATAQTEANPELKYPNSFHYWEGVSASLQLPSNAAYYGSVKLGTDIVVTAFDADENEIGQRILPNANAVAKGGMVIVTDGDGVHYALWGKLAPPK